MNTTSTWPPLPPLASTRFSLHFFYSVVWFEETDLDTQILGTLHFASNSAYGICLSIGLYITGWVLSRPVTCSAAAGGSWDLLEIWLDCSFPFTSVHLDIEWALLLLRIHLSGTQVLENYEQYALLLMADDQSDVAGALRALVLQSMASASAPLANVWHGST